jgi:hypothetical protein
MQVNHFLRRAARPVRILFAITLLGTAVLFVSEHSNAQQSASVAISVKDHRFQPSQISAPANRPISIRVKNLDSAPMEFESSEPSAAPDDWHFALSRAAVSAISERARA